MVDERQINLLNAIAELQDVHAAVFFTFGADLVFFEEAILRPLWQANCHNILIYMDSAQYENTIRDFGDSIAWAGVRYLPVPVAMRSLYVFHPKMMLLLGETSGRLLVGSGNVGFAGFGRNLETYSCFDWSIDFPESWTLFRAAWELCLAINDRLSHADGSRQVLQNIPNVAGWLDEPHDSSSDLTLVHTLDRPLLPQIRDLLAGEQIEQITIITPFLDQGAEAITALLDSFQPTTLRLILQNGRAAGDMNALRRVQESGHPLTIWTHDDMSRYLHAKVYVFETADRVHILTGSANCTRAALLASPPNGNVEIGLLRRGAARDAYSYLLDELALTERTAALDSVAMRPIPAENPSFGPSSVTLQDVQLQNRVLTVKFLTNTDVVVDTLQLKIASYPPRYLNLDYAAEGDGYFGSVTITPENGDLFARPLAVTFVQRGEGRPEQNVGCNLLWVTNHDLRRQETLSARTRAARAGDQLRGMYLTTASEWSEFADNLWMLIELEVQDVRPTRSAAARERQQRDVTVVSRVDEAETEIVFIDATDEGDIDQEERQMEQALFEESDLFALLDRVRGLVPGSPRHSSGTVPSAKDSPAIERPVGSVLPPKKAVQRIVGLIRRYVDSLGNKDYLASVSPYVIIGHYVVFQNIIGLLDERQVIDKKQIVEWLVNINSKFFSPIGELPPLADEQWSRHLSRERSEVWAKYGAAEHALASILRVHSLLQTVDDSILKAGAYALTAPTLASLATAVALREIGETYTPDFDRLLPSGCEDGFNRAAARLVRGARPAIVLQLGEWIDQLNLLSSGRMDSFRSRKNDLIRVAYLTAQYELLVTTDRVDELVDLCDQLAFWARVAGKPSLSDQWYTCLFGLHTRRGSSDEAAQALFDRGKQLVLNKDYQRAVGLLEQACIAAERLQNETLIARAGQFLWLAKTNL